MKIASSSLRFWERYSHRCVVLFIRSECVYTCIEIWFLDEPVTSVNTPAKWAFMLCCGLYRVSWFGSLGGEVVRKMRKFFYDEVLRVRNRRCWSRILSRNFMWKVIRGCVWIFLWSNCTKCSFYSIYITESYIFLKFNHSIKLNIKMFGKYEYVSYNMKHTYSYYDIKMTFWNYKNSEILTFSTLKISSKRREKISWKSYQIWTGQKAK